MSSGDSTNFIQPELNYRTGLYSGTQIQYFKQPPLNGLNTCVIPITGQSPTLSVESTSTPFYEGYNVVSFDLALPAQATGLYLWGDIVLEQWWQNIQITARESSCQLNITPNQGKIFGALAPFATSRYSLEHKSNNCGYVASTTAVPTFYTSATLAQQNPLSNLSKNYTLTNVDGLNQDSFTPYNSYRKLMVSTGTATQNYIHCEYVMNGMAFTAGEIEQLMYWNNTIRHDFCFGGVSSYFWAGSSNTNPLTGAVLPTGTFTVSNFQMYFAQERNSLANEMIRAKVLSTGITLLVPWIFSNKYPQSGTNQGFTYAIQPNTGNRLLFVATAIYNGTESINTNCQHDLTSILSGGVFTSLTIQTSLNGVPLQINPVDCFQSEHWLYHLSSIKDSCINSLLDFNTNFLWIDNFTGGSLADKRIRNQRCGKELGLTNNYSFQMNAGGTSLVNELYLIICTQRELYIGPQGVKWLT